jgi:hypothetical protein
MDKFYIIVLTIALVLLILILTYVGLLMNSSTTDQTTFPPTRNICPDYWQKGHDVSSCAIPSFDSKNIGTIYNKATTPPSLVTGFINTTGYSSNTNDIDFTKNEWSTSGKSEICAKKNWANTNGILWDGVSNYNGC